ncbi:MAG: SDR family NAD(P)-dependent oxidoreductase [Candidatus Thermoplasmatota archaeon]|nr:SDR family NAD(P)-dependent oxidoreductase [Candidatus Thermoplasmatota archaeon]
MKDVLVTGGCGFIGTNLIEYLLEKTDLNINVLDNLSEGKLEYLEEIDNYSEDRIIFFEGDIRDEEDAERAIDGCDYVINLAAQTSVMDSIDDPERDAEINIMGTINLLEAGVREDVERFILASSAAPLGEQEMPIDEDKVPEPLAPYGASKLACEGYCSAYAGSFGLETVALRFSNVYGPKSWHKGSVVAKFIKQILKGETPVIYGDGGQTRDFIHTRDISQGLHLACVEDLNEDFELFQIATGEETSINELYSILERSLEEKGIDVPEPEYGDEREGEIYRNYADISKAEEKLNYSPAVPLEEGIEETIDWFLESYKR